MRRAILGGLAIVLACLGAPARADTTYGWTAGINGVLYDDCRDYPYRYSVNVPDSAGYRAIRVSLFGPDGGLADTDYVVPDANQWSGTGSFLLCRPTDPFGTYTIRAAVEWGADPESIGEPVQLDPAQFSMRKPFTRTTLSVSTRRPAYGQVVRYRITARDERPEGYVGTPFAWVHLQKRVDGRWVRIKGSRAVTHSTGRITVRLRYAYHHKRMRVRAVTKPSARYSRSVSPVVRIW